MLLSLPWVVLALFHFLVAKPNLEYLKEQSVQVHVALKAFREFNDGNVQAINQIEETARAGNGVSYLLLKALYDKLAIEQAGVDMDEPGADMSNIDLSKSDKTLRDAMQLDNDFEMRLMLIATEEWWDPVSDDQADSIDSKRLTTAEINWRRLDRMRSFTDDEKAEFKRCADKLNDLYSTKLHQLLFLRSTGTCKKAD